MEVKLEAKEEPCEDFSIYDLEDEEIPANGGNHHGDAVCDDINFLTKNGDTTHLTEEMIKEEEKLLEVRIKEEAKVTQGVPQENADLQFKKLDDLLTQTQIYSEFLLEKMDNITTNNSEIKPEEAELTAKRKKSVRGRKRKTTVQYDAKKAKTAVAAMLTRSHEDVAPEDVCLTEEERAAKEQAELVPLMTGGKLKPYQVKGVKWMISLWQNGLNGILADQMGLGKTIQTLAFLAHLKGNGLNGPFMVIAPLSTLSNWGNEVTRFVPSMKFIIYHGSKTERASLRKNHMPKSIGTQFPLVITSYEVALNDTKFLAQYTWMYVVVDEGHRLKNFNCLLVKRLKLLPIENKLLLTGTPLQNNLAELWSLLNFILPHIFSSHEEFESWFDFSAICHSESGPEVSEEYRRAQVVSKLHSILRPFLLRRMKKDVEQNLPQKKEIILYADMTPHQKKFNDLLLNKTLESYLQSTSGFHLPGIKRNILNMVIQLRKNCNHPDLLEAAYDVTSLYPPVEKLLEQCGKFQLLDRLVTLLLDQKHKVLIFSQWTKVLDIIEYYFCEKGMNVCRLDGRVKLDERRRQIDAFNDLISSYRIFLLSTRAGGLGINLTAADTCVLYDSDWNPQMDLQAMDRCHRIGQTRPVHVYRLATSHSVEGRMLKRAFGKLRLENVVIGHGQFHQDSLKPNTLEESEILALLRQEEDPEDKLTQITISDEDLMRVMNRSDLVDPSVEPLPLRGPGWEVVLPAKSSGGVL